ncbi:Dolichyl-phosphate-mannose-protein mannosyltransferase-domain-containing protein [Cokeromyces recurvatus]|uniref:Dolichyl-phosphate-mannose-protein mannosyltransferase-domain-containing protein n=1 Tax=Cokeromyces recurvatus TaxID=90255 RepID=UPI00221F5581|nr:Dolichyl-phosphate-mannose-protein mannosyltransferase-domain-containing protein [Cokeromyces recurvatus]KAI7907111.1 Dolichyl-phosphate-mannose-protein mannosyltransferase-domain-containing protein [Cokeromyces recurvatus]
MMATTMKRRHIPNVSEKHQDYTAIINNDMDDSSKLKNYKHLPQPQPIKTYSSNKNIAFLQKHQHTIITIVLTLLSFWTRFRKIALSKNVVWDEAHFGKFGSHYLNHDFYFDVHPPLGKILVGFSGWLAGYNGSFGFESGAVYPEHVNFGAMRIFNAFFGAMMVPIAYLTCVQMKMTLKASLLAATMVLLDNAYLTISRFILLDSMLLFFTCTSLFTLATFHNLRNQSFSTKWWIWLNLTGISLGCVLSVKWVGLFAVAVVGVYTIEDLWNMWGDLQMPKKTYLSHWIARIICLICIPISIYIFSFILHFKLLYKSGPGDAQMSSLFQANLEGNSMTSNPLEIAYGSKLTIKNAGFGGGLLHSHVQTYPEGSKQQQVTCYHHKDDNNNWIIRPPRNYDSNEYESPENEEFIRFVKDGDIIRLQHELTGRNLHSHPVNAPVTSSEWEVSCYGNETVGDSQDNWKVEIVDDMIYKEKDRVRSLTTRFRLRHERLGCLLTADGGTLPQWGFKQTEVYCDKSDDVDNPHAMWNVEQHWNPKLPPAPPNAYKSRFFRDFISLNVAMWNSNNALIPDPDKYDILSSKPSEWPFVSVGLRMCGWGDNDVKFYLLGNPIVWWLSIGSIFVFCFITCIYIARMQRKIYDLTRAQWDHFFYVGKTLFLGWFFHYIPFYIMGRVTYLHHYFPALYFSILMVPFLMDHFTRNSPKLVQSIIFGVVYIAVIATFIHFAPISFGLTGPITDYKSLQWREGWNIIEEKRN